METEKIFYNAVAIALEGNPGGMRVLQKRLKKKNGDVFPGWETAYRYLAGGGVVVGKTEIDPNGLPDPSLEEENMEQRGIRLVFIDEPGYPSLLREIHHPPLALYAIGELPAQTAITIVGTRNATPDGKTTTRRFAYELARAGFTIVSGLALGVDAEAHKGCLDAGAAKTIAILARGLDRIYPAENQALAERILESGGAIISEYPPAEPPYPDRFIERNRIVSGLSKGTLVVEAPLRSGSLATANFAMDQDRDLFVVPGSILHPNFFGSHILIRQGAELVTKPEEILQAYEMPGENKTAREMLSVTDEEKQVLIALRAISTPADVDKIIELTKLEPRVANQTLSFLLVKGLVKETQTGYIIE